MNLEGFVSINGRHGVSGIFDGQPMLSITGMYFKRCSINKATIQALGNPERVEMLMNVEKKLLLVRAAKEGGKTTSCPVCFESGNLKKFLNTVEALNKVTRTKVEGTVEDGCVIFDVGSVDRKHG